MHMLYSQILEPLIVYTFYDGFPATRRQLCIVMQIQQFSIHKMYITMQGKLSELHCSVSLFSSRMDKVQKLGKLRKRFFG